MDSNDSYTKCRQVFFVSGYRRQTCSGRWSGFHEMSLDSTICQWVRGQFNLLVTGFHCLSVDSAAKCSFWHWILQAYFLQLQYVSDAFSQHLIYIKSNKRIPFNFESFSLFRSKKTNYISKWDNLNISIFHKRESKFPFYFPLFRSWEKFEVLSWLTSPMRQMF